MPTFKQAAYIRRALESLRAQTLPDWELVVVDDGSPDETGDVLAAYLSDPRVRYHRLPRNRGLGAALNSATELARGEYLAYLPSDDVYHTDHLEHLVALLEARPDVYLAYGGLRWGNGRRAATLHGDGAVGREAEALAGPPLPDAPTSGNLLALVQVMHRREPQPPRWPTREEIVSDTLEADFWRALLARHARFAYAGAVTCEWVEHHEQRHRVIAGVPGGLSRYRAHYGVGRGEWLDFRPSRGMRVDEAARYGRFAARRELPGPGGLRVLLVGSLGFNPERVLALEERGHKLYGLWSPRVETWDGAGPFPFGNVEDIPLDTRWRERVRAIRPDVVYALLNFQALPLIREVVEADFGAPVVFHYKEGPFPREPWLWPDLMRIFAGSDGLAFISEENREWYRQATDGLVDSVPSLVLDGDLPKADWMTDEWAPKLSAEDGQIHTVCAGRPLGMVPWEAIAAAGIHVHFYGVHFHEWFPNWTREGLATGFMHLHPTVEPGNWVRELSRYDAGWVQLFHSANGGDLRRADWDDLNLPSRLNTYAAAGLPWIMRDNRGHAVAMQSLAERHGIGVLFGDYADLAAQLRDRGRMAALTANARTARRHFAFDSHADALVDLFRRAIERHRRREPAAPDLAGGP